VYVATGEGYVQEALRSATRLKAVMPNEKVCLITDVRPPATAVFDEIIETRNCVRGPIDKVLAVEAPFDDVIFVDTDTYAVSDLTGVFDVLKGFDFALLHETRRGWDYELPDVPRAFSEYNTGVVAFRNSPEVKEFFREWRTQFDAMKSILPVPNTDQPSFRRTIFHSKLRIATLPSEYHFLSDSPNYVMWDAKLIHGRRGGAEVDQVVNSLMGCRVYVPHLGVIGAYEGRKGLIKSGAKLLKNVARCFVTPPADLSQRAPAKWWPDTAR
jgi:hypothetical protein